MPQGDEKYMCHGHNIADSAAILSDPEAEPFCVLSSAKAVIMSIFRWRRLHSQQCGASGINKKKSVEISNRPSDCSLNLWTVQWVGDVKRKHHRRSVKESAFPIVKCWVAEIIVLWPISPKINRPPRLFFILDGGIQELTWKNIADRKIIAAGDLFLVKLRCMTARDRLRAWDVIFLGLLI